MQYTKKNQESQFHELEEQQRKNTLLEMQVNELLKKLHGEVSPGLYPIATGSDDVYERAMFYYLPNRSSDLNHLNRFHDYLTYANPVRAFSVLANLYFDYGAMNPGDPDPIATEEDRDEFGLMVKLFAGLAVAEHDYIRNDREDLLREMYGDDETPSEK